MEIRKATIDDIRILTYHLRNKKIDYLTINHMKEDISNHAMYILLEKGEIIGCVSLVETEFEWLGIKRLCIFNKKNNGKGYASKLLRYVSESTDREICVTPWSDNVAMRHLLEKIGYHLEYIFNGNWCSYKKNNDDYT